MYSLAHALSHLLIHLLLLLGHVLTSVLTHSLTHFLVRSLTGKLLHLTPSLTHSLTHLLAYLFTYSHFWPTGPNRGPQKPTEPHRGPESPHTWHHAGRDRNPKSAPSLILEHTNAQANARRECPNLAYPTNVNFLNLNLDCWRKHLVLIPGSAYGPGCGSQLNSRNGAWN